MAVSKDPLQQQLEHEVARLRDLAVRSTDPLLTAKAVAASDPAVQSLVLARMQAGERLVEVLALGANRSDGEIQVFFRFVPASEPAHLVDAGLLAFVDCAKGEVLGTVDPYDLQPEHRPGRPFVAISPLDAARFTSGEAAARSLGGRQDAFFRKLGVMAMMRGDGFGGIATVRDTRVTTHTWSNGRSDDTRVEYTDDYVDCGPADDGGILA